MKKVTVTLTERQYAWFRKTGRLLDQTAEGWIERVVRDHADANIECERDERLRNEPQ